MKDIHLAKAHLHVDERGFGSDAIILLTTGQAFWPCLSWVTHPKSISDPCTGHHLHVLKVKVTSDSCQTMHREHSNYKKKKKFTRYYVSFSLEKIEGRFFCFGIFLKKKNKMEKHQ